MTRNQVKGIEIEFRGLAYREANWGLGWGLQGVDKWRYFGGDLFAPEVFNHGGFGGAYFWVDRKHEIVGVYLSVAMEVTEDWEQKIPADLFQNLVTGGVA